MSSPSGSVYVPVLVQAQPTPLGRAVAGLPPYRSRWRIPAAQNLFGSLIFMPLANVGSKRPRSERCRFENRPDRLAFFGVRVVAECSAEKHRLNALTFPLYIKRGTTL